MGSGSRSERDFTRLHKEVVDSCCRSPGLSALPCLKKWHLHEEVCAGGFKLRRTLICKGFIEGRPVKKK